jgi:hypothetical protein
MPPEYEDFVLQWKVLTDFSLKFDNNIQPFFASQLRSIKLSVPVLIDQLGKLFDELQKKLDAQEQETQSIYEKARAAIGRKVDEGIDPLTVVFEEYERFKQNFPKMGDENEELRASLRWFEGTLRAETGARENAEKREKELESLVLGLEQARDNARDSAARWVKKSKEDQKARAKAELQTQKAERERDNRSVCTRGELESIIQHGVVNEKRYKLLKGWMETLSASGYLRGAIFECLKGAENIVN